MSDDFQIQLLEQHIAELQKAFSNCHTKIQNFERLQYQKDQIEKQWIHIKELEVSARYYKKTYRFSKR